MSITSLLSLIAAYALILPLELFVFFGALLEEVIAPIPSPFVMTTAGSLAHTQGHTALFLVILGFIGAIGKTLGALLYYLLADKAEDIVLGKFGKFIGVSHREVEGFGRHFSGGLRDDIVLIVLRALPVVPSAIVSIVCGTIKLPMRTYIISSLLGFWMKNLLFLWLGYAGGQSAQTFLSGIDSLESVAKIGVFVVLLGVIGALYIHRHRKHHHTSSS